MGLLAPRSVPTPRSVAGEMATAVREGTTVGQDVLAGLVTMLQVVQLGISIT